MKDNLIRIDTLIQDIYFNGFGEFKMLPTKISMSEEDLLLFSDDTGLIDAATLIGLYEAYITAQNLGKFNFMSYDLYGEGIEDKENTSDPKPLHILLKIKR